jgi:hypothetical protein
MTVSRPAAANDPFFNCGGIKNGDALQPALIHDAVRGTAR